MAQGVCTPSVQNGITTIRGLVPISDDFWAGLDAFGGQNTPSTGQVTEPQNGIKSMSAQAEYTRSGV